MAKEPQDIPQDIGVIADHMVLYFVTDHAPAMTPMCQWNFSTGGSEWVTQCCAMQHNALQLQLCSDQVLLLGLRMHKR